MIRKNKRIMWGLVGFAVSAVLFMTWFYPFSTLSLYKSYTYKPGEVLYHNDQSYKEILYDFKQSYEKELRKELENSNEDHVNVTITRTEYILPVFEQDWLIGTDPVSMNKNKVDEILGEVIQARNILLRLVAEENYPDEQRVYLVDMIDHFLRLEDEIRYVQDGSYFLRNELYILFSSLRNGFRSNFNFYVTVFYDEAAK